MTRRPSPHNVRGCGPGEGTTMKHRFKMMLALALALTAFATACGSSGGSDASDTTAASGSDTTAASDGTCDKKTDVKLQLQWFTQAQFAGYYDALEKGYYDDQCLNVTIIEGGTDIVPQQVLADGGADFAIAWVPKALASREAGADIVDIAQVFQRSGTTQVSFKSSNITTVADFKGKKVGNWGFGNEWEVFAALTKAGLDPAKDVENVQQDFDMSGLLSGDIDAAEAMTYNELAQVLEAENPDTGKLYTLDDLNVLKYEDDGVGMLQDAIWADGAKLKSDAAYKDTATKFVAASLKGWADCRDDPESCRDIVVAKGSKLGKSHQLWQMNEINKLIWPADEGVGTIVQTAWDQTVQNAMDAKNLDGKTAITKDPGADAYTNDIVKAAQELLTKDGVDIKGDSWKAEDVTLEKGGA